MSLEKPLSWNAARDRHVLVISPDYMIAFILNYIYMYFFFNEIFGVLLDQV